jgi:flagellar hook-associated protein 3 FlgL
MRIATANAYGNGIANLQSRQSELVEAQGRLTSGKRVERASDDPTAAARAERALAAIGRSDASQRALQASRNSMTLSESALGDAGELLQQAREAMVSAGNASYTDAERDGIAKQLGEIRKQLLAVANRGDGAGGYLFAGQGASQPPFLDAVGGVAYRGTSGQQQTATDEQLPLTVDGKASWLQSSTGNGVFETRSLNSSTAWIDSGRVTDPSLVTGSTYSLQFSVSGGSTTYSVLKDGAGTALSNVAYSAGQSIEIDGIAFAVNGAPAQGDTFESVPSQPTLNVFDTLDRTIAELKAPLRSPSAIAQGVQRSIRDIDASSSSLQGLRTTVGETLKRTDSVEDRVAALKLYSQSEKSDAENLDLVQAISDFKQQQTGYDAALQTYATVQRLSLFQYIT